MALPPAKDPRRLHGAIDLGTHSCLLLVGRLDQRGELEIRHDVCEVPRLGEGLHETGQLGAAGMDRTVAVLARFAQQARELGVMSLTLCATAAMRRATNRQVLIDRVRDELDLELRVISEAEEAELGWVAATACLRGRGGAGDRPVVVVDVGGGSTEVVANGGARLRSFPVGGIVLTERFGTGGSGGPGEGDWPGLLDCVQSEFAELADWFPGQGRGSGGEQPLLIALGGTPCNLGCLELGLASFDHEAAEGLVVPCAAILPWGRRLARLDLGQRIELPVEPARAAVLPAGLACLGQVATLCGACELLVTGKGLRYGILSTILRIG